MFDINWTTFVAWLWPPVIRTSFWVQWCRALISPVVTIYNQFTTYRADNLYKLAHTSQVWSIEKVLNDKFDPIERRIYISDAGGEDVILLFPDTDVVPLLVDDDATGTVLISNDSGYFGGSYDFVVINPYLYSDAEKYRMKAWIDYFKLAGKRYDINP